MEGSNPYRPGFFEVYAAHHLSGSLRPALRFVLEVLAVRHPFLIRAAAWSDEIFSALLLMMETSQLQKESALLAESFYSLRRSTAKSFNISRTPEKPLQTRHILFSVFFSVLVPHFKTKLDSWYASATGGAAAELFENGLEEFTQNNVEPLSTVHSPSFIATVQNASSWSTKLSQVIVGYIRRLRRLVGAVKQVLMSAACRRLILKWYSRVSTVCESVNLLLNILYLFGHTRYFSLSLAIQGLILRRTNPFETLRRAAHVNSFSDEVSTVNKIAKFLSAAVDKLITLLKAAFFIGIFVFRFLQYYYAAEASAPRNVGPVLPPPMPLQPVEGVDRKIAQSSGICPLCSNVRVSPTACSTSGYMFCYLCIYRHIERTGKCPVTLAPATVDDLIRVYDDANTQGI